MDRSGWNEFSGWAVQLEGRGGKVPSRLRRGSGVVKVGLTQ